MKETQGFDRKHITDVPKKYRKTIIIYLILFGCLILGGIYANLGIEDYGITTMLIFIFLILAMVYYILVSPDKQIYVKETQTHIYCTSENRHLRQSISMGIVLFLTSGIFIGALHDILTEITPDTIVFLVASIIMVMISLWGVYKITQKKFCDEFPKEFFEEPSKK